MANIDTIKSLLTRDAQIRRLERMQKLTSSVVDSYYGGNVVNHPFAYVSEQDVAEVTNEVPVVKRGSASIPLAGESGAHTIYEPESIIISRPISARDLADLGSVDKDGAEQWITNKTEWLRKRIRKTTEALASQTLTGTVAWPMKTEVGYDTYSIAWGSPLSVTPSVLWNANGAKSTNVADTLDAMKEKLEEYSNGASIEIWAASDVYSQLRTLSEATNSLIKRVPGGLDVDGYVVKRMAESYRNPQTGSVTAKVAAKSVIMFDKDASQKLAYMTIDDLDAGLKAMPFFIKTVKTDDPSGWKLIAHCRPFPMPNMNGIVTATVLS